jgi:hypothetical protein
MNINDVKIILIQNLGMKVEDMKNGIITYWKIKEDIIKEIVFFHDTETKLLYISIRFENLKREKSLISLLRYNLSLSLIKFCLDEEKRVILLVEIPDHVISEDLIKRSLYALSKAAEKYYEIKFMESN